VEHDVIVIGGGAAGLMATIFAAEAGAKVVLLEATADGGRKILISGGGRCNVLPSALSPSQYITDSSPNTLKKLLLSWPLADQRRFFEETLRIPLVLEPESGKLFPRSNRARDVRDGLVSQADNAGVHISSGTRMERIATEEGGWTIGTSRGEFRGRAVIIATGGLSVPQTGSDGRGLSLL
jgi:predicted Rossmann fold flavoprotein